MKASSKVKMSYKRFDDDTLIGFANNLVENGKSEEFAPYKTNIDTITALTADFTVKVQKAKNKGRVEVDARNAAKDLLLPNIDVYAYLITAAAVFNPSIINRAGFEPQNTSIIKPNPNIELAPPYGLSVVLRKNSGEIELSYQLEVAKRALKNGVEWSDDNGLAWHNGTYISGKKGVVKNLPIHKNLLIRVCSIGTYERRSDFSVPIEVYLP